MSLKEHLDTETLTTRAERLNFNMSYLESISGGETDPLTSKVIHAVNEASDPGTTPFDIVHTAQQGVTPIDAGVVHNYGDGRAFVIDNVGTNKVLLLHNTQNTVRRADEDENYVGTGDFVYCSTFDNSSKLYVDTFKIDQFGNMEWGNSNDGEVLFVNNTTNTGEFGFKYKVADASVTSLVSYQSATSTVLQVGINSGAAQINSGPDMTNGMRFEPPAGHIRHLVKTGEMHQFYVQFVDKMHIKADGMTVVGDVGFYNTTPVAQPTGVSVDAAGIHAALVTLGLITA